MDIIESLHAFAQIKLLADQRRLEILRLLMASPATLTQISRKVRRSPAWVRHHLQALESANMVEMTEIRTTGKVTEKYYRARAAAFLLQEVILPKTKQPIIVFSGSHDLGLEDAARRLASRVRMLSLPVGSLDGLVNLRLGLCQLSGAHLLEAHGEYNISHVQYMFPDLDMELLTVGHRSQGLMLAPGNPKRINGIADLARPGIRFVNRNRGSGTRLWLDSELKKLGVPAGAIYGYERLVKTHTEAAALIRAGSADAALGLQAAARQNWLDFIPLFEERYDLVLPRDQEETLAPLLDYIQSADFRRSLDMLTGYNTAHSGEQIPVKEAIES
jgi:molybdate-binding protein/DNA-binding HxlR family transcriptional regulator